MVAVDASVDKLVENGTLHGAIFSDPDIYQQELTQIFARMWLFVGHESQIPKPGDFVRSRMGEEQVIVTRAPDNRVHVLLNSCSHRGNVVCRYDHGFSLAFQCSFHGWTFNSMGELTTLPPGSEDLYAPDLRKEEWGLLQARVETFQGTIWATWDQSAPNLVDYFGGAEAFMGPALADADGSPDGTEVAGGVMKWRIGMNWKVPMPDNDNTHFWVTHRSAVSALGLNPAMGATRSRSDRGQPYHVWFPEGHTTSMRLPADHDPTSGFMAGGQDEYPLLREYLGQKYAARRERLGNLANGYEPPHIFPNMGSVGRIFRILHPHGPSETEMWSYILVDKAAPPEVKEEAVRYHERRWGPNGYIQKDDMENWYIQTQRSRGFMTRTRLRHNAQLRMSTPSLPGPATFGLPGMYHPAPTDENIRRFYGRWAQVMGARNWDEMRVGDPAR